MIGRAVDFDVDVAAPLAPRLTSANKPITAAQYRLLQGVRL